MDPRALLTYHDITLHYRLSRLTFPPPHQSLSQHQQHLCANFRPTPSLLPHVLPSPPQNVLAGLPLMWQLHRQLSAHILLLSGTLAPCLLAPQKSAAVGGCFVHTRPDLQLRLVTWADDVAARHCLDPTHTKASQRKISPIYFTLLHSPIPTIDPLPKNMIPNTTPPVEQRAPPRSGVSSDSNPPWLMWMPPPIATTQPTPLQSPTTSSDLPLLPPTYSPACRLCGSSIANYQHIFYSCPAHLPPASWHLRSPQQWEAALSSTRPDLQLRLVTWADDVAARHCLDATTGSLKAAHNAAF
ncbi:hypothetical protein HPB50_027651 [Hyalomma asiaticum]|nr:hypothetical protein HPB50_027651 [Hyalomma asiaticum]